MAPRPRSHYVSDGRTASDILAEMPERTAREHTAEDRHRFGLLDGLERPVLGLAALGLGAISAWLGFRPLVRWWVRRRLGPNRRLVSNVDPALPVQPERRASVAVIGGGLAGISAASLLGRRGLRVALFEKNAYLGGKIGSAPTTLPSGERVWISHGFHAFFRHYHNLNRFLDELGLRESFRSIGEYTIVESSESRISFDRMETTPILNLLSLARQGVFRFSEVLTSPARDLFGVFLEYERDRTFQQLDEISFAELIEAARLPPRLRLVFNTFARAFFADADRMSLAELVKSVHCYFLGHEGGLVYDHPTEDYERSLLAPIRDHLNRVGVELRLDCGVDALRKTASGFEVRGERFDAVIVATHAPAARRLVLNGEDLVGEDVKARFEALRAGQPYSAVRCWIDHPVETDLPVFVTTDRVRALDAIAFYHRIDASSAEWAERNGGAVLELYCYALPDDLPDDQVPEVLWSEARTFLPTLARARILHRESYVHQDFTAFHVGSFRDRPGVDSGTDGLYFAGDWVKLDFPAMLMEAAFSSGLVAGNRVLERLGLRQEEIWSIPPKGVLAGVPEPPKRKRWIRAHAASGRDALHGQVLPIQRVPRHSDS